MNTTRFFILLLLIAVMSSACTPSAPDNGLSTAPQAWFDAPLPGTIYYPPNPCMIVAHGASPVGISQFELSINGGVSTNIPSPDSTSSLVTLSQACGLTNPGEYFLQLRARDNDGNWSGFAETSLIIPGEESPVTRPTDVPPASVNPTLTFVPTLTSVPLPTLTPVPAGGVSLERISTNLVFLGGTNCGTTEVNFVVRATAPNGITGVYLFYRFQSGNASTEFQSVNMNPMGGDLYERTLNPTSILGGTIPFDAATLQYQIVVQQTNGDTSIRTPVFSDITVQACGGVTTSSCSQYTDERTCLANACKWGPIAGTRTIGCQTP